jgi:dihydrofolate reductase
MQISIIAALADDYLIGSNNKLPWQMPADLKHFKELTLNKPVIMGRKTYASIGMPLPGRKNIVISRNKDLQCPGCEVYDSLAKALAAVQDCAEVMIIGGAEIYKQALPLADKMYLTFVHGTFIGDAYFPKWNPVNWQEIERKDFAADAKNPYPYSFVILERKSEK